MKWLRYIALSLLAVVMLLPFLWMLATSLETPDQLLQYPPVFLPTSPRFANYLEVFEQLPMLTFFANSVKISVLGTLGELIAAALAAFAFARMNFRGKRVLFAMFLATMMVPFQVTMIPVFMIMRWLGWLDSHASLIVPHFFGGAFASAAFGIFLLRQFFAQVPRELEEAARIDGAGRFRFFLRILLPLSIPALSVLALFAFMGIWNDLLSPVLFLSTESRMPLTFGLAVLQTVQHNFRYDLMMAGTMISVLPVLVLFIFAQKRVTASFLQSGLKG
jgi:multiple sugar transport system permease protein